MIPDEFPAVKMKQIQAFGDADDGRSKGTRVSYRRSLNEFVRFFVLDRRFMFRVRDVERYKEYLLKKKKMKELSAATYMTALRRFLQFLVERGVLEKNAAKRVQGGKRPTAHFRSFLMLPEIDRLLGSIETDTHVGLRDRGIIRVMLGCACAEIEIASMDVGDLQKRTTNNKDEWVLTVQGKGKSVKDEEIPVPLATVRDLERYFQTRLSADKPALRPEEPMFISYSNRSRNARITLRGLREAVMQRLKDSGVKHDSLRQLTPFSLRHTAGVLLVEQGASVEELMHRMRIDWRPTAMLYFKQKGKLGSEHYRNASDFLSLG
jgi:integrase/recombinase XerC